MADQTVKFTGLGRGLGSVTPCRDLTDRPNRPACWRPPGRLPLRTLAAATPIILWPLAGPLHHVDDHSDTHSFCNPPAEAEICPRSRSTWPFGQSGGAHFVHEFPRSSRIDLSRRPVVGFASQGLCIVSVTRASEPGRRKLIAVLYADMVGYSRLIGLDDAGTLERLRALRGTLIDPAIEEHGGRIVQTGGDFLLVVFDSIDGAVRCAVKVQQQVPIHDGDQPPDRAIRFRVGINIGDAIADGTDLHGDAVNVAARLRPSVHRGHLRYAVSARSCAWAARPRFRGARDTQSEEHSRPVEAFLLRPNLAATGGNHRQGSVTEIKKFNSA